MLEIEIETRKRSELAPTRLGEKLHRIRRAYGLTQGEMLRIINPTELDDTNRARVSQYERGERVPSIIEIFNYAKFAGITIEILVNDALNLPAAFNSDLSGSNAAAEPSAFFQRKLPGLTDLNENAPTEAATLELLVERIDELHNLQLELLRQLPRSWRSSLTLAGFTNFCLEAII